MPKRPPLTYSGAQVTTMHACAADKRLISVRGMVHPLCYTLSVLAHTVSTLVHSAMVAEEGDERFAIEA